MPSLEKAILKFYSRSPGKPAMGFEGAR